jgi:hypothetical protein
MSGYRSRAPFYRSEFAVRDDFPLLKRLLAGRHGLVIDIPSGAGRLMPVHQAHRSDVIMVDIEPAMTAQCQATAKEGGLAGRVSAVHGDITTWQPPSPAWTLTAFAMGALAGMGIRRAVPAIVATLACYTGLAVVVGTILRANYQPTSHFRRVQWIEGSGLLALSALLIAVTIWLVHRRAA